MIEKQGFKNFSSYNSKSYISVLLSDLEVTFLQKGENAASLSISLKLFEIELFNHLIVCKQMTNIKLNCWC